MRSPRLVEVMREQGRAGCGAFASELHRGGLAKRLLSPDDNVRRGVRRLRAGLAGVEEPGARGTTHISVVDAAGNAASLTDVDRLRLGRDRPRDRHPPEQHARRVRPESCGEPRRGRERG